MRDDDDLRALGGLADLDDVRLDAVALRRTLERHLLGLRQQCLDAAEVEQRVALVGLLDDAGDDVALAVRVLLELALGLDLADALAHHLTEGLGGDAAELFLLRRVVALVDPVAVLVDVVGDEREVHRLGVDLDDHLVGRVRAALVGRGQGVDQHMQQGVVGDLLLLRQQADRFAHVEIAHDGCVSLLCFVLLVRGFLLGPQTNTVLALSILSYGDCAPRPKREAVCGVIVGGDEHTVRGGRCARRRRDVAQAHGDGLAELAWKWPACGAGARDRGS